jgi:hypothetical protein
VKRKGSGEEDEEVKERKEEKEKGNNRYDAAYQAIDDTRIRTQNKYGQGVNEKRVMQMNKFSKKNGEFLHFVL